MPPRILLGLAARAKRYDFANGLIDIHHRSPHKLVGMAGDRRGVMLLDLRRGRIVQLCHELHGQPGQELGRNMRVPQRVAGHDVRVLPNRRNSTGERAGMVALVPAIAGWLHKQRRHEGLENAAPGALAFASDISAGTTTVVAAISASGVKNFQPWPASTTAVVVAADRDEGVGPNGRHRDKAGEDAARELCMRVREHTNFAEIARPARLLPTCPASPGRCF